MTILEGDAAKEFTEYARERNRLRAEEELKQEKIEALKVGKENFNYEKLISLVDISTFANGETPEQQKANLEYIYYVRKASLKSIEEFANDINEINQWAER